MIRRVATLALVVALVGCGERPSPASGVASSAGATSSPAPSPAPTAAPPSTPTQSPADRQHPQLRLALLDGTPYDLAQHRGRWVIVNFWATWCGPCIEEMPQLSKLAARDDVDVIGLAYEDIEPQAMRDFLAERKPAYPIAIVDTGNPPADFDTPRGLPMTVLVAPDGSVAKTVLGPVTIAVIDEAIAAHGRAG